MNVILFIQVVQDLELLIPLGRAFSRQPDFALKIIALDVDEKNPFHHEALQTQLRAAELASEFIHGEKILSATSEVRKLLENTQILMTATETSARPHRFARALTDAAREKGIFTITLQHGFENIGLTYFDQTSTPESVYFHSDKILIWGEESTLHFLVTESTRKRCVSVGCPKDSAAEKVAAQANASSSKISVFENLHWDRYSDSYRQHFLDNLEAVASEFPQCEFLVKPHPGGRWLTDRYKGQLPAQPNIKVVRPATSAKNNVTATDVISQSRAVITTPSTIAFDAALAGVPVLVVGEELDLARYEPLRIAQTQADWIEFIHLVSKDEARQNMLAQNERFVRKSVVAHGSSAQENIVNFLRNAL